MLENHRHMNILSSGKIIWILAESCVFYFIAIISRIITAQQIHVQYNEIKKNYMYSDGQKKYHPCGFGILLGNENCIVNFEINIQLNYTFLKFN